MKDKETLDKYENLLHSLAWKFHRVSGLEEEDLFNEAVHIFYITKRAHQKSGSKNKLSTWVFRAVKHNLAKYVAKNDRPREDQEEAVDNLFSSHAEWDPLTMTIWHDTIEKSANEVRVVLDIILETPSELLQLCGTETPRTIRKTIVQALRKWQWNEKQIRYVMSALKGLADAT